VPEHLRALEAAGARPAPVRRPEELDRLDGLVIPGGESTTLWRLSVPFAVLEPLRKRVRGGLAAVSASPGSLLLAGPPAEGRQRKLLATAFHPELTQDRRIHQLFVDIVKDNT